MVNLKDWITLVLLRKVSYLKPGKYQARIISAKVNRRGNLELTLGDIESLKDD